MPEAFGYPAFGMWSASSCRFRVRRLGTKNFPLAHPSFPPVRTLWRTPLERSEGAFLRNAADRPLSLTPPRVALEGSLDPLHAHLA